MVRPALFRHFRAGHWMGSQATLHIGTHRSERIKEDEHHVDAEYPSTAATPPPAAPTGRTPHPQPVRKQLGHHAATCSSALRSSMARPRSDSAPTPASDQRHGQVAELLDTGEAACDDVSALVAVGVERGRSATGWPFAAQWATWSWRSGQGNRMPLSRNARRMLGCEYALSARTSFGRERGGAGSSRRTWMPFSRAASAGCHHVGPRLARCASAAPVDP